MKHRLLFVVIAVSASLPALGQTTRQSGKPIYRCGNEISDRPCAPAAAPSTSPAFDQPSSDDAEAARRRSAADAKQARALQQQRERFERQTPPAPVSLSGAASSPDEGQVKSSGSSKDSKGRKGNKSKPREDRKASSTPSKPGSAR